LHNSSDRRRSESYADYRSRSARSVLIHDSCKILFQSHCKRFCKHVTGVPSSPILTSSLDAKAFHPQLSRKKKLTIWRRSSTEKSDVPAWTLSALVSFRHRRSDRFRQELTTHWKPYCVDRSPVFLMITERLSVTTMLRPFPKGSNQVDSSRSSSDVGGPTLPETLHFWCVNPDGPGLLVILLFTNGAPVSKNNPLFWALYLTIPPETLLHGLITWSESVFSNSGSHSSS